MPTHPSSNGLLKPIRKILNRLLLGIPGDIKNDPELRARVIVLADLALVSEFPPARAVPTKIRQRLIAGALDAILGGSQPDAETAPLVEIAAAAGAEAEVGEAEPRTYGVTSFLVDGESSDLSAMEAAATRVLGEGWKVAAMENDATGFTISHPEADLSVTEAWELAHQLEEDPAVALAEPDIEWVPAPADIGGPAAPPAPAMMMAAAAADKHLSCSGSHSWSVDEISLSGAWGASPEDKKHGRGVKVGHLDTGLTDHIHQRLNDPRILLAEGANLYDPDHPNPAIGNRPLDPMDSDLDDALKVKFKTFDGHGTSTLSVLLCDTGPVTGTAPAVTVVPFRIGPTVVHFNVKRIAEGIRRAHRQGCDVITMSMGGPPSRTGTMERAVRDAVEDGVIICCAAGNVIGSNDLTPIVVWPAALDEVIAVAGSNCRRLPWSGSSRGPEVNITAPAQDVWRLSASKDYLNGHPGQSAARGEGTSYATPATAGVAACWLARHGGRQALAAHYGHPRYVPQAFAHILRTEGYDEQPDWNTKLMGPGILNAEKVLKADLPPKSALNGWPKKKHTISSNVISGIFKLGHWLTPWKNKPAMAGMAAAAEVKPATLKSAETLSQRYGSEVAYLLFDRPELLKQLVESGLLDSPVAKQSSSPAGMAAAAPAPNSSRLSSAAEALEALREVASPSLAAALP
ncbi:MAG: S8/S53 family peptidase [Verrucomicrobiales bacterium]|nr:S8/S53 family peptidase [Verrucomicrobiales bacterium]